MSDYDKWRQERDCGKKRRYTRTEARHRAAQTYSDGKPRRAYRCAFCGWWHVGGTRGFEERDRNEWPKGGES